MRSAGRALADHARRRRRPRRRQGGGISLSSLLAVRLGLGSLPRGVSVRHLLGAASLAGIGFTVSLFIADLAFADPALRDEAKIGVLAASVHRRRARVGGIPPGGERRR